jgi:hypothetical protein
MIVAYDAELVNSAANEQQLSLPLDHSLRRLPVLRRQVTPRPVSIVSLIHTKNGENYPCAPARQPTNWECEPRSTACT